MRCQGRICSLVVVVAAGSITLLTGLAGCGSNAENKPIAPEVADAGVNPGAPNPAEPEVQRSVCPTYPLISLTAPGMEGAQPALLWNGSNYLVAYSGAAPGGINSAANIYVATVTIDGARVGEDVLVGDTADLATSPELAPLPGDLGYVLVYENCAGPSAGGCALGSSVHAVALGLDGRPRGPAAPLTGPAPVQRRPYLASGHGNVYVSYRDVEPPTGGRTVARLHKLDGNAAKVGDGIAFDPATDGHYPFVAVSPTEVALAYQRTRVGAEIVLALIDPATLAQTREFVVRSGVNGGATNPVVQWNANRWVIAWEDEREGDARIYATVVSPDAPVPFGEATAAYDENGNWPAIASGDLMTSMIGFYGYPGRRVFLARVEASGALKPGQVVLGVGKFPSITFNPSNKEYAVAYEDDVNHRVMFARFACSD